MFSALTLCLLMLFQKDILAVPRFQARNIKFISDSDDILQVFFGEIKTWADARDDCRSRKSELISIVSAEENGILCKFRTDNKIPGDLWMGGTDKDTEGTWTWTDNSPPWIKNRPQNTYSNWGIGEPSNDEQCIWPISCRENLMEISENCKWNDAANGPLRDLTGKQGYICAGCQVGMFDLGNVDCKICPPGTYSTDRFSFSCLECEAGRYLSDAATSTTFHDAASDCIVCGMGSYSPSTGASVCVACPSGRYLTDNGTSAGFHDELPDCASCSIGKYLADNSATNFALHDAETDCSVCEVGKFTNMPKSAFCFKCSAGKFLSDASTSPSKHDQETDCLVCGSGRFSNSLGVGACSDCDVGKALPDGGTDVTLHDDVSDCKVCGMGSYSSLTGASVCLACPSGRYLSDIGTSAGSHDEASDCTSCSIGKFLADNSGTNFALHDAETDCSTCPLGTYASSIGTSSCLGCAKGKFLSDAATSPSKHDQETDCLVCGSGRFSNSLGNGACSACAVGKTLPDTGTDVTLHDDVSDCKDCLIGSYSSSLASATCSICDSGKFSSSASSASCTACSIGKYLDDPATSAALHDSESRCLVCSSGRYAASLGSISCSSCAVGKFNDDEAKSASLHDEEKDCKICDAGTYSSSPRSSKCLVCDAGRYLEDMATSASLHSSASSCSICPAGRYLSDKATSSANHDSVEDCKICAGGTFLSDAGTSADKHDDITKCSPCAKGKYNGDLGTTAANHDSESDCKACAVNTFANTVATIACTPCDFGLRSLPGAEVCGNCPPGYTCTETNGILSQTPCDSGYYSSGNGICTPCEKGFKCPGGSNHIACYPGSYQSGEGKSVCIQCAGGKYQLDSSQDSCLACPKGYFCPYSSSSPEKCGSKSLYCPALSAIVQIVEPGYYSSPDGDENAAIKESQTLCPVGFSCLGGIKTPCIEGKSFQSLTGRSTCNVCSNCAAGYSIKTGCTQSSDTVCTECEKGKSSADGVTCITCDASIGLVSSQPKTIRCDYCGPGRYADISSNSCLDCTPSYYSEGGTNKCTLCTKPGSYSETRASYCTFASAGYMAMKDKTAVTQCPINTYSTGASTECTSCGLGHTLTPGSFMCLFCAPGMYFDSAKCVPCRPGKYSESGTAKICADCTKFGSYSLEGASFCSIVGAGQKPKDDRTGIENCPVDTFSAGAADNCTICNIGLFSDPKSSSCQSCEPGKYFSSASRSCERCKRGFYSEMGNDASCSKCDSAKGFVAPGDGYGRCDFCGAGKRADETSSSCISCDKGKYSASGGSSSCSDCSLGKVATAIGSTICLSCDPGNIVQGLVCQKCSPGKFATLNSISCSLCKGGGSYSPSSGASYCNVASAGKIPTSNRTALTNCGINTFSHGASENCTQCPEGGYSSSGSSSCHQCRPGKYYDTTTLSCNKCPNNTYSEFGATLKEDCKTCGTTAFSDAGSSICTSCPQYQVFRSDVCVCDESFVPTPDLPEECTCKRGMMLIEKKCVPCKEGTFKSNYGISSCTWCDSYIRGSTSSVASSTSRDDCRCPKATYMTYRNNQYICAPVFDGMSADVSGMTIENITLLPGYWRIPWNNTNDEIRKCLVEQACIGSNNTDHYCKEGHEGYYCNLCKKGYSQTLLGLCKKCSASSRNLLGSGTVFFLLIINFVFFFYGARRYFGQEKWKYCKRVTGEIIQIIVDNTIAGVKIMIVTYQILANLPKVIPKMAIPANNKPYYDGLQFFTFNIFDFVSIGCVADVNFYGSLSIMASGPLFICVAMIAWGKWKGGAMSEDMKNYAIVLMYCVLPTVTISIFGVFSCEYFDYGNKYMLMADYSIDCRSPIYKFFTVVGFILIIIYPLGIPFLYAYILVKNKDMIKESIAIRSKNPKLVALSFLFDSYKPEYWYFELFVTVNRLALTGILGAISPGTETQLSWGMFMSFISVIVYCIALPYNSRRDNLLSIISNAEVFFVLLVAFLLKRQRDDDTEIGLSNDEGLGWILIIFNALNCSIFIGWVIIKVVADINDPYGRKARESKEREAKLAIHGALSGDAEERGNSQRISRRLQLAKRTISNFSSSSFMRHYSASTNARARERDESALKKNPSEGSQFRCQDSPVVIGSPSEIFNKVVVFNADPFSSVPKPPSDWVGHKKMKEKENLEFCSPSAE